MDEKKRAELIAKFKPQLNDITNPWGNALYKHAIGYNPEINLDSPVTEKIDCLPVQMADAYLLTVEKIQNLGAI